MSALLPEVLRRVNAAQRRVNPEGAACFDLAQARDDLAMVAFRRLRIENKLRVIQAHASRGRGMRRADLARALEEVIADLRQI